MYPGTEQETTGADAPETPHGTSAQELGRLIADYHNARVALIQFLREASCGIDGSLRETLHSVGVPPRERF